MSSVVTSVFEKDGPIPNPPAGYLRTTSTGFQLDEAYIKKNLVPLISAAERQRQAKEKLEYNTRKHESKAQERQYRDFTEPDRRLDF